MKGYAEVDRNWVAAAILNWEDKKAAGIKARDVGIGLYYEDKYQNGNFLHKWWFQDDSPQSYAYHHMVYSWGPLLNKYLTDEQVSDLKFLDYANDWRQKEACEALLKASQHFTLNLGEELCAFVNEYKM